MRTFWENKSLTRLNKCSACRVRYALAFCVLAVVAAGCSKGGGSGDSPKKAENVIVMIADGWGFNHIDAANMFMYGDTIVEEYERFPFRSAMTTFSASGQGYDPDAAWTDFDYVKTCVTDSAAAATAMATGIKTNNGRIGVDTSGQPVMNLVEYAEGMGKATGVVTSVQFTHATPASFVAHNISRDNYLEIAVEMIQDSEIDVIMGCGHPAGVDYRYVGGEALWNSLVAGGEGWNVDADHNGLLDDPWTLVDTLDDTLALMDEPTPARVIVVPKRLGTLQYYRGGDRYAAPFVVPFNPNIPTLAEMTKGALNILDDDPDGFFLMVEGGAVDWASHGNASGRMIEEMVGFNDAVSTVLDWTRNSPSGKRTLIIVTGDHETGYLTRALADDTDIPWSDEFLLNNGIGQLPGMLWNSEGHTNSLIPVFAKGPSVNSLDRYFVGTDPSRGPYIDNTTVGNFVFDIMD